VSNYILEHSTTFLCKKTLVFCNVSAYLFLFLVVNHLNNSKISYFSELLYKLLFIALFLPRDAMRKRRLCCRPVSLRPSVRPFTLVHCIHVAEDIVKLLSRPGSSIILVSFGPWLLWIVNRKL